jgi:hypothetical protein
MICRIYRGDIVKLDMFIADAIQDGKNGIGIPAFVPEGPNQDMVFDWMIGVLVLRGFRVVDVRDGRYQSAIQSFPLNWPEVKEGLPPVIRPAPVRDDESMLLVVCGEVSDDVFWRRLCDDGILYAGAGLPIMPGDARCIMVPDQACVAAIIRDKHLAAYRMGYFGRVGRFTALEQV